MKTVEDMARDAGIPKWDDHEPLTVDMLERFANLIRADALVKPCCGDFDKCQQICMPRAAAQEREACAKLCEGIVALNEYAYADECATAIQARSNT